MDQFVVDYLRSGKAWLLIGSGPSNQMGYPSWEKFASLGLEILKKEARDKNSDQVENAIRKKDFPKALELLNSLLGTNRLLQHLHDNCRASRLGKIYELIARWPVPVYLTTNYDDEIQKHLTALGESYVTYSNTEDHFAHLQTDLNGGIFKIHGDLRSNSGLILTTSQYNEIENAESWKYWRTKLTSVFQMNRLIVIGHSLTDKNVRHVLEAAKQGSGVIQPVCWIAPDVTPVIAREYLEKFRIRVISYDNQDGEHNSLLRLIEHISDFVPSRTSVHVQDQITAISRSPMGIDAAAPGFFVFNKLGFGGDCEEKRVNIMLASIQSALTKLKAMEPFTFETALSISGWPMGHDMTDDFSKKILNAAIKENLLSHHKDDKFNVGLDAESLARENKAKFEHVRDRFISSLCLRLKRGYPTLSGAEISLISSNIEASLTGYFREGGLTLATALFSSVNSLKSSIIPSTIIGFITKASTQYDDILKRQAFCTVSVDAFIHSESAERDYLGRISHGFFAFHALGVFGDAAIARLRRIKETVWLVDSSAQIPALALAAPTNLVFYNSISKLYNMGIRLFTTQKLFEETKEHLWFANKIVSEKGPSSNLVLDAAKGQAPFKRSNQFLEGFIRWRHAGNPADWEKYMFETFGNQAPKENDIKNALNKIGIEVIPFNDWPGYLDQDLDVSLDFTEKISGIWESKQDSAVKKASDPNKKAQPEAEALVIIKREREGDYNVLSDKGIGSPAWFISHTSILNLLEPSSKITWQPEAFVSFVSTLSHASDSNSANQAFETLLWGFAQAGVSLLDDKMLVDTFGGIIDQATLSLKEQQELYDNTVFEKYGESAERVLERISPLNRPMAAAQLLSEMTQIESKKKEIALKAAADALARACSAEKKLAEVERYRRKMEVKRASGKRKAKKQSAKSKKKKKK